MHESSFTRRRTAFVPWLAALVFGATAHAGWWLHEHSEHAPAPTPTVAICPTTPAPAAMHVEVDEPAVAVAAERRTPARFHHAHRQGLRHGLRHCRQRLRPARLSFDHEGEAAWLEPWLERTGRYSYRIDRRALADVHAAGIDGEMLTSLAPAERGLAFATPPQLRNIRAGTPLHLLGLRTGDRLLAVATNAGAETLAEVELSLERRGRRLVIRYELV